MGLGMQVIFGSALLVACTLIHVGIAAASLPLFQRIAARLSVTHPVRRVMILLSVGVLGLLFAHTVQIWLWALIFHGVGAFETFETAFYFATVTYTTLGYGDLTLGTGLRVTGTFAAISGLLTFGISTAFLFGLVLRLMPGVFDPPRE